MAKHVFRLFGGMMTHEGSFVRRTERTVFYLDERGYERRVLAGADVLVAETDDPAATKREFTDRWCAHAELIREASATLRELQDQRRDDALSTLQIVESG